MLLTKERDAEPIPGYRLLEPLGKGGFGQVWKCEAPGGLVKAIKFVDGFGLERGPADEEFQAIQRIKALRHPFLLSIERVEVLDGELIVVTELADKSLHDLLAERVAAGQPGVERGELLAYLREAADVLDLLNRGHGLQHLDIKPANLFLVAGHAKVADFGLVHSFADRPGHGGSALGSVTPRYAAPELFRGIISPTSDQYSLAIVYQELLTGSPPFSGKNPRELAVQQTTGAPNLEPLPPTDRAIVARALSKNPKERFASCTALVRALEKAGPGGGKRSGFFVSPSQTAPETKADFRPADTPPARPIRAKHLPGYQFLRQLGRTAAVESWAARSADGHRRLVKFLFGVTGRDRRREAAAVARLRELVHDDLPPPEIHDGGPGCLIVVTDLIETSLRDRFQECRGRGERGLPRRQLIDWFAMAAETLDELARNYQVQHLGLNPRNLLVEGGRLLLADFGLIPLLWQPAGLLAGQIAPRYTAPELLAGGAGPHCDQYSLAVIYQEMLTGQHPLRAGKGRPPNLDPLTGAERAAVARALEADPDRRFPSCTDFLHALEKAASGVPVQAAGTPPPGASRVLAQLLAEASDAPPAHDQPEWLTGPRGELILQGRFHASLPPQGAAAKFEAFRRRWSAELKHTGPNLLAYHVGVPGRFWQGWFGKPPGLRVEIHWTAPRPPLTEQPQVTVRIRPDCEGGHAAALTTEIGPAIFDSLREQFLGQSERRAQERLLWARPVAASFVLPDGSRSERVECQGKDISLSGMGLYLPCVVPGARLELSLPRGPEAPPVALAGSFVRVQRCGDGWFEAGVRFE